jgi:hypothetical protein
VGVGAEAALACNARHGTPGLQEKPLRAINASAKYKLMGPQPSGDTKQASKVHPTKAGRPRELHQFNTIAQVGVDIFECSF